MKKTIKTIIMKEGEQYNLEIDGIDYGKSDTFEEAEAREKAFFKGIDITVSVKRDTLKKVARIFAALGKENKLGVYKKILEDGSVTQKEFNLTFDNLSLPQISLILKEMIDIGLLERKKQGNVKGYVIKDHVIASIVRKLLNIE